MILFWNQSSLIETVETLEKSESCRETRLVSKKRSGSFNETILISKYYQNQNWNLCKWRNILEKM